MPFEFRETTSGGMVTGSQYVTREDGVAVLAMLRDQRGWRHLVVDVSASEATAVSRREELDIAHHLARLVRDLELADDFKLAIVSSPTSDPRVADFLDFCRSVDVRADLATFTSVHDALAWADATVTSD